MSQHVPKIQLPQVSNVVIRVDFVDCSIRVSAHIALHIWIVPVHYISRYASSGIELDNSFLRNKPEEFIVGSTVAAEEVEMNRKTSSCSMVVIPGVDIAIRSMKKNERSTFWIGAKYGHTGYYGDISKNKRAVGYADQPKANEDLEFEIKLLNWRPNDDKSLEDSWVLPFDEKVKMAQRLKDDGTMYFKENRFLKAFRLYKRAVNTLKRKRSSSQQNEELSDSMKKQMNELMIPCLMNMSACCLKLKNREQDCISYCTQILEEYKEVLTADQKLKTLFRRGQAHLQLSDYEKAREDLTLAKQISPDNKAVAAELRKLQQEEDAYKRKLKKMYSNMFD